MNINLVACAALLLCLCANAQDHVLNLMFISSGGGQYNSSGAEPAVDLAVDIINENNIIPGVQLNIASRGNSSCDRNIALESFLNEIIHSTNNLALIGCGCSIATEPVAEISNFWNITHLSYASSTDSLSDRMRFPNFWRTHTSEANLASSVLAVMKEYNWTVIKIITQEEALFTDSTINLKRILTSNNVTVDENGLTTFMSSDNITNTTGFYQPEAALNNTTKELYVPGYVWITLAWYRDNWWTERVSQDQLFGCEDIVLKSLINQTLGIQQTNSAADINAPTDVNLTAEQFTNQYIELLGENYTFEPTSYYAYDAVWALAFAINRSIPYLVERNISIENFSYNTGKVISDEIQAQLNDSTFDFIGVSGNVNFDENGTREGSKPLVYKYRDEKAGNGSIERVLIAVVNGTTLLYVNNESSGTVWPGYVLPDGTPTVELIPIKLPVTITLYILASAGIIFALFCLFFNVIFRNRKIVRLISPNLNYIIIIGGILMYSSVYFYAFSSTIPIWITVSCHIRYWLQTMGYFMCFGTIVVKMWRIYYIFHNPTAKKKSRIPKDWQLFLIVMAMCMGVTIVGIIVAIFADYGAVEVNDNETSESRNETTQVIIQFKNLVCEGPNDILWIAFVFGCIIITQLVAVFLAFRTRKVTIKALNDSKYLTVIIYLSTVIITAMLISAVALSRWINADAAIFGSLLLFFTTIVLGLMFIPKMVILYKDPKGEKIFERGQSQGTLNTSAIDDANRVSDEQFQNLEKHCVELEGRLGKYEAVLPYRSLTRSSSVRKYSLNVTSPSHAINPKCEDSLKV